MRFIGLLLTLALISAPATAQGLQTREPAVCLMRHPPRRDRFLSLPAAIRCAS